MAGYSAAFITLAGVSLAALFMFLLLMPETRESPGSAQSRAIRWAAPADEGIYPGGFGRELRSCDPGSFKGLYRW